MKLLEHPFKFFISSLLFMVLFYSCSTESKFTHLPRVKVDGSMVHDQAFKNEKTIANIVTDEILIAPMQTSFHLPEMRPSKAEWKNIPIKKVKVENSNERMANQKERSFFVKSITNHRQLQKVNKEHKTSMERWMLAMIILYVLAFVFLLLALVFNLALLSGVLFYVFLVVGFACLLAASIILPLGLSGII